MVLWRCAHRQFTYLFQNFAFAAEDTKGPSLSLLQSSPTQQNHLNAFFIVADCWEILIWYICQLS